MTMTQTVGSVRPARPSHEEAQEQMSFDVTSPGGGARVIARVSEQGTSEMLPKLVAVAPCAAAHEDKVIVGHVLQTAGW